MYLTLFKMGPCACSVEIVLVAKTVSTLKFCNETFFQMPNISALKKIR